MRGFVDHIWGATNSDAAPPCAIYKNRDDNWNPQLAIRHTDYQGTWESRQQCRSEAICSPPPPYTSYPGGVPGLGVQMERRSMFAAGLCTYREENGTGTGIPICPDAGGKVEMV